MRRDWKKDSQRRMRMFRRRKKQMRIYTAKAV
jgi:hypothetical protein